MASVSPWLVRSGALLALASFGLPRYELSRASSTISAVELLILGFFDGLGGGLITFGRFWLTAPIVVAVLLLVGSFPPCRPKRWLRVVSTGILLLACFAMATYGSIAATSTGPGAGGSASSFSAVVLFALPVLAGSTAMAMILGGAPPHRTGAFVRASLGLLLFLDAACVWPLAVEGHVVRALPGLYLAAAAGLLAALGELPGLLRDEPSPQPAVVTR